MGENSGQMPIPSTMLEPSTGSMSLPASARLQRQQQQPTPQNQQTPSGSVHDDEATDDEQQEEIEKDLSRKLEALSAAAKATNQRLAEVSSGAAAARPQLLSLPIGCA
ncbi:hypothetical protein Emag_004436 [Eimeria magna]